MRAIDELCKQERIIVDAYLLDGARHASKRDLLERFRVVNVKYIDRAFGTTRVEAVIYSVNTCVGLKLVVEEL